MTDPAVTAIDDALRLAGIRTIRTQEFSRGGPCFLVGKGGINRALMWVNSGAANPARPQVPREVERYIQWLNYGQTPLAPTAVFANTPAEAVTAANYLYVQPTSDYPTNVVIQSNAPTGPVDAFQNAFKHNFLGEWNNYGVGTGADASRFMLTENPRSGGFGTVKASLVQAIIKSGDSIRRAEFFNSDNTNGKVGQAGDTMEMSFEVSLPAEFPALTTQRNTVARVSAFTNGTPPIEFMLRKNGSNVDTLYLRENGATHDGLAQTSLDAAGGYLWSTPVTRASGYGAMNYIKLTARMLMATDATAWVELYRDYNFTTPVLARTNVLKTLTDTSGTVRSYARFGPDQHSSFTGDARLTMTACRVKITRP